MLIKELGAQGSAYEMEVMVASADIKQTKGGKDYLSLTLQDSSGNITVNVWDSWKGLHKEMLVGNIFCVSGVIDKPYQDRPQIKIVKADFIAESVSEYTGTKEFSPSYCVNEIHIQYVEHLISELPFKYKMLAEHMFKMDETWQSFIQCPAAKKHHGAKIGGLLVHTIAVIENVRSIYARYSCQNDIIPNASHLMNLDRLIFMALIHDIGKIYEYVWIPAIDYRKDNLISHIYHAVHMLIAANKIGNTLEEAELQTICFSLISHHGEYGEVKPKNLEDWILHIADLTDAHLVGAVEG